MPNRWVHATMDLIAFGLSYLLIHKEKDAPYQTLGPKHRSENHQWYQEFGKLWTLSDPFPPVLMESLQRLSEMMDGDGVEEHQVFYSHDYLDKVWDTLSRDEKKYWEGFFAWVLSHPSTLKNWAGVDVLNGKIHRSIEGQEIWEDCPEVKSEYKCLLRYVEAVISNDEDLQHMLKRYGETPL